jgi:hypothetical protein
MSFTPVLDVVLFSIQDDGNTAMCVYFPPDEDQDLMFKAVYKDGDDHVLETVDGDRYIIPPWDVETFEAAVACPQHFFQPMDQEGDPLPYYDGEFLSAPPAARFGV